MHRKKPTIAICVPTRGLIHARIVEWLVGFEAEGFEPLVIFNIGKPMPDCREELCEKFLETGADYLFFLDDDTIPPLGAIDKLLAGDKPIITGITWGKRRDEDNRPMIGYQNPHNGIIQWTTNWVWPARFQIDGCGLSCCLIRRDVIEAVKPPRFAWNWKLRHKGGGITDIFQGEDIFFCMKAKLAGLEIWCDSSVQCQHLDIKTNKEYPSPELWQRFHKKNVQGRTFTFDNRTQFNIDKARDIVRGVENGG